MTTTTHTTINGATWTIEQDGEHTFVTRTAPNAIVGAPWASGMTVLCEAVVFCTRPEGKALQVVGGRMDRVTSGALREDVPA